MSPGGIYRCVVRRKRPVEKIGREVRAAGDKSPRKPGGCRPRPGADKVRERAHLFCAIVEAVFFVRVDFAGDADSLLLHLADERFDIFDRIDTVVARIDIVNRPLLQVARRELHAEHGQHAAEARHRDEPGERRADRIGRRIAAGGAV